MGLREETIDSLKKREDRLMNRLDEVIPSCHLVPEQVLQVIVLMELSYRYGLEILDSGRGIRGVDRYAFLERLREKREEYEC